MFDVCTMTDMAHIDMIFKFLQQTPVNMGALIFFTVALIRAFRSVRSRGSGGTNTFVYLPRNAHCTVTTDLLCDIPTHRMTSPPEQPFSHYIHSHRLAEIWTTMKNNLLGKKIFSYSFYLYRFCKYVSYSFPVINLCNPGVNYEMPCISSCMKAETHEVKYDCI